MRWPLETARTWIGSSPCSVSTRSSSGEVNSSRFSENRASTERVDPPRTLTWECRGSPLRHSRAVWQSARGTSLDPRGTGRSTTHCAAHDGHHLVDVGRPFATLNGVGKAPVNVVLEQEHRDLVRGGGHGLHLLQDVQAVRIFTDQAPDATHLALDPAQAVEQLGPILRVAVAEVPFAIGARALHTRGQYAVRLLTGSICRISEPGRNVNRDTMPPMPELERHELFAPLERALVVFSHPDDAEFGAAATIASLVARGVRVDYLVTTDGGKGTDDPAVTSEQLATTRIAEQRAAADVLGVGEIVHLGYPDGYLQPTLDLRRDIVRHLRRLRPELVIAQSPMRRMDGNPYISHPDHLATGEATLAAIYPAARDRLNFPELLDEGLEP